VLEKFVVAAVAGTASLLLLAAPATAQGADEAEEPWLKDGCLVPFRFQGPVADALKLDRTVVSAACIGQSKA
jgi:hypothetical protein